MKVFWLVILLFAATAKGDVAIYNLDGAINGGSSLDARTPFTTDSAIWDLTTITIDLYSAASGFGQSATVSLSLYSDIAGTPGPVLTSFGSQTLWLASYPSQSFITFSTPFELQPDTTYWIGASSSAEIAWYSTPSAAAIVLPGWSLGDTEFLNPSYIWQPIGGGNQVYKMELDATAAPEPAVSTLLIATALTLFTHTQKRK